MRNEMLEIYANALLRHKGKVLAGFLLAFLGCVAFLPKLQMANLRTEDQLRKEDPVAARYQEFTKEFGNDLDMLVAFEAKGSLFTAENLALLKRFTEEVELFPEVERVTSLANANYQWLEGEELNSRMFLDLDPLPSGEAELERLKAQALGYEPYRNNLVSADGTTAILVVRPKPTMQVALAAYNRLLELVADPAFSRVSVRMVGETVGFAEFNKLVGLEAGKITLIMLGLMVTLLVICFRSVWGMLLPGLVTIMTIVMAVSTYAMAKHTFSGMALMVTAILFAISLLDTIHFFANYQREYALLGDKRKAAVAAITGVFVPCLFTALTTAVGFASLAFCINLEVAYLGIHAGIGALIAFILTFAMLPCLVVLVPAPKPRQKGKIPFLEGLMGAVTRVNLRRGYATAAAVLALCLAFSTGTFRVRADQDNASMLPEDHPVLESIGFLSDRAGVGWITLPLLVKGDPGAIKDPVNLRAIDRLEEHVRTLQKVKKVHGFVDEMKITHRILNGDVQEAYRIPADADMSGRLHFMVSNGEDARALINHDHSRTVVNISLDNGLMSEYDRVYERIARFVATDPDWPSGLAIEPAGLFSMLSAQYHSIMKDQVVGLAVELGIISLILAALFRSFKTGLITLIPNVLPIFVVFGFMGWTGIYLSGVLIVVANIAIGLAVDDTIHLIYNYRKARRELGGHDAALGDTLNHAGIPMILTCVVLIMGMSGFLFSSMPFMVQIGQLLMIPIIVAVLADLFLMPTVLKLFKVGPAPDPKVPFRHPDAKEKSMSKSHSVLRAAIPLLLAGFAASAAAAETAAPAPGDKSVRARSVLEKELDAPNPKSYASLYEIEQIDQDGKSQVRTAVFLFAFPPKGGKVQRQILYFLSPKELQGNAALTENSIGFGAGYSSKSWVYDPLIGQVKLNSVSNWRNRAFGSNMTVFDRLFHDLDWFDAEWLGEEKAGMSEGAAFGDYQCDKVLMKIRDGKVRQKSGYNRMVRWIDRRSGLTVKYDAYNLKDEKVKTVERYVHEIAGFWLPNLLKCVSFRADGRTETTRIAISNHRTDMELDYDGFFNKRTLEAGVPIRIQETLAKK